MTSQSWNSTTYEKHARFVTDLGAPVLNLLSPQPGETILDIGCGDGVLTKQISDLGCNVTGVDSSEEFIHACKRLGLNALHINAYDINFTNEFDAVFSNAALHWMKDPEKIIANIYKALTPKGRFVAECGGYKCVDTIKTALITELTARGYDGEAANPWYFAKDTEYKTNLEKCGFNVEYIELIPRPTPLPGDVMGWLTTFSQSFTDVLPSDEQNDFLQTVRNKIKPDLCDKNGLWTADYIRLRFLAFKP